MRNTTYRQPEWFRYADAFARFAGGKEVVVVENPYGGVVPELAAALAKGRGYDRMRLSLYEAAAFGTNMTVPYGSWMGATQQDSFWAPHELLVEAQDFLAATDGLRSSTSANELAVVYSIHSLRDLVSRADASDNLTNARDLSVVVPYRVTTEALSHAATPFDVLIWTDGELVEDRSSAAELSAYATVVLPGCWWLTEQQVAALEAYLDAGGRVVVTEEPAQNLPESRTDRLRSHPGLSRSSADDVAALQPRGPQVMLGGGAAGADVGVHLQTLPGGGAVACHLISYGYDEASDAVPELGDVTVAVRLPESLPAATRARVVRPGQPEEEVGVITDDERSRVELRTAGLYTVVVFGEPAEVSR